MSASVSLQYAARVAARKIERDSGQQAIVDRLAQLEKRLAERRLAHKSSSLGWLFGARSEEHTSELQSRGHLVCRLLLEKKNIGQITFGGGDAYLQTPGEVLVTNLVAPSRFHQFRVQMTYGTALKLGFSGTTVFGYDLTT